MPWIFFKEGGLLRHKSGKADSFCNILLLMEKPKKRDHSLLQRECGFLFQEKPQKVV